MGEKGELARGRILEAAKNLFHLRGYSNTSIDDIVSASGLTKGSVYHYFSSKEELGTAAVEELISDWLSSAIRFSEGDDPVDRILSMFRRTEKKLSELRCKGGCVFGNLALEVSDLHDGLRQKLAVGFSRWESEIEKLIAAAQKERLLRRSLNPASAAHFIIAAFEGGILLSKVKRDVRAFSDCTEMVSEFLGRFRTV